MISEIIETTYGIELRLAFQIRGLDILGVLPEWIVCCPFTQPISKIIAIFHTYLPEPYICPSSLPILFDSAFFESMWRWKFVKNIPAEYSNTQA